MPAAWEVRFADDLSPVVVEALRRLGIRRLGDDADGEGTPLRVLRVPVASRHEAVNLVLEVPRAVVNRELQVRGPRLLEDEDDGRAPASG